MERPRILLTERPRIRRMERPRILLMEGPRILLMILNVNKNIILMRRQRTARRLRMRIPETSNTQATFTAILA